MYEYKARIVKVVDADTVWADVDLGFDVRRKDSFRLFGIDAPEMGTPEGVAAKAFLEGHIRVGDVITVRTEKDRREKFGRYLANLYVGDLHLNAALIDAGHATVYPRVAS